MAVDTTRPDTLAEIEDSTGFSILHIVIFFLHKIMQDFLIVTSLICNSNLHAVY